MVPGAEDEDDQTYKKYGAINTAAKDRKLKQSKKQKLKVIEEENSSESQ